MERSHIYNGRNNSRFGKELPYSIQRGYVNSQQVSHFGNVINKDSSLRPTLRQNHHYIGRQQSFSGNAYNNSTINYKRKTSLPPGIIEYHHGTKQMSSPRIHQSYYNHNQMSASRINQPYYNHNQYKSYSKHAANVTYSPGSTIFNRLAKYANHLYSLFLLENDLVSLPSQPNRNGDVRRILSSLSSVQFTMKDTPSIRELKNKIRCLTVDLAAENLNLMLEAYNNNLHDLQQEIASLINPSLKFVPKAGSVLRFIRPNMARRRL
jgi:hypothetical protein